MRMKDLRSFKPAVLARGAKPFGEAQGEASFSIQLYSTVSSRGIIGSKHVLTLMWTYRRPLEMLYWAI